MQPMSDSDSVPRDAVWQYVRGYGLPRQETIRMAGSQEGAIGLHARDRRARISRTAAIRLLGEAELDARHPAWGEQRAYVARVPAARSHFGEFPWCSTRAGNVEVRHTLEVQRRGLALLRIVLDER